MNHQRPFRTLLWVCCCVLIAPHATAQPAGLSTTGHRSQIVSQVMGHSVCGPEVCRLPDCHCASVDPPGELDPSETPQFILLTLDDGVSSHWESFVTHYFGDLRNPDGRPALRTYFVNVTFSETALIRALYDEGHEIANHTATHHTNEGTTAPGWRTEIETLTDFLVHSAGIPASDVVGFRAPYLATNEAMWQTLGALEFVYDSSVPEQLADPPVVSLGLDRFVWPHTMDYGLALSCFASHCPEQPVPGLWTIPIWVLYDAEQRALAGMDPFVGDAARVRDALSHSFALRYAGNRAPLGLYLHRGPLAAYPDWATELRTFLLEALALPDVWIITMRGLIEWMKNPVPANWIGEWFDRGCHQGGCVGDRAFATITERDRSEHPERPGLEVPYPNPFHVSSDVVFSHPADAHVRLILYDALGRRVDVLIDGHRSAGTHCVSLDGHRLAPGTYFLTLDVGSHRTMRAVAVAR